MTTTLQFPEASLSILASDLPNNSTMHPCIHMHCLPILHSHAQTPRRTTKFVAPVFLVVVASILHYASPRRLTGVLVTAIASVEKTYFDALEIGLLSPSDVHMVEMLYTLQLTVSKIREASLRNSLSLCSTFREFLNVHTFTLLSCIREILKESQLREDSLQPFADRVRSVRLDLEINKLRLGVRANRAD
ncbi:hypothetical protein B0H13DRAFT_1857640 [Mycena leptocephala]|nr:hypothetical protein B0H13DRAFT_1857640 [Mycena leptocephala]